MENIMAITKINVLTGEQIVIEEDAPVLVTEEQQLELRRSTLKASAMQIRMALEQIGRLDEVEAIVAQSPRMVQIAWANAAEFNRNSQMINNLAPVADPPFTPEDLDLLFELAKEITV